MPEFVAIQCFSCEQYQVSQVKKQSKFNCKICGKKQSIRFIRGKSEKASQVRKLVQQLNLARGTVAEQYENQKLQQSQIPSQLNQVEEQIPIPPVSSRWKKYQQSMQNTSTSNTTLMNHEDDLLENNHDDIETNFVTAIPDEQYKHPKRKRRQTTQSTSSMKKGRSAGRYMNQSGFETISPNNLTDQKLVSKSHPKNSRWCTFQSTKNQPSNDIFTTVQDTSSNFAMTTMDGDQVVEEEVDI